MNIEEVIIFVINTNHNETKNLIRDLKKSIYYQFKKDYQFKIYTIKQTKEFKFFSQEK